MGVHPRWPHHPADPQPGLGGARETTARVAAAGVAKRLLAEFGITILSHVTEIGGVHIAPDLDVTGEELRRRAESSEVRRGMRAGARFRTARRPVHDEILFAAESGFRRLTNNAGGLEGGVTNGQPVVARAVMKPLSTLRSPLKSVDLATKEAVEAVVERSDVCAVPAAGIVGEAMMAIVLAGAFLEKFGGDSLEEIRRNYDTYLASLKTW